MINPRILLVGAGPGDPELLTLKALNALKTADVILYDALVDESLLEYCQPEAIKVFVGKRAGLHHYQQFVINKMMVDFARSHGTVVRLKGGDPYVFGRGHEEFEYALKHGIEVQVIPGVTSAISVPALQHIPLTKRGKSQSFTVLTATNKEGLLCDEIQWASTGKGTVVILMGIKKLEAIVELFSKNRSVNEPVGIIQEGSTVREKIVIGTMSDIQEKAKNEKIGSPGIIIIGPVVEERKRILNLLGKKGLNDLSGPFEYNPVL